MPARADWRPPRALAWLYVPPAQRDSVAALFDLEAEIGTSLKAGLDHDVAHARLAWWQEECRRCTQGEPAHPLTRTLLGALPPAAHAPLAHLESLVSAAAFDLAGATFETQQELSGYCRAWSAALFEPCALLLYPSGTVASTGALGAALRELELLCAAASDAQRGRLRLPLAVMAAAQVPPQELARTPWPAPLVQLVGARHRELRIALAAAVGALARQEQRALCPLLVWCALAAERSRRALRALPGVPEAGDHDAALDGYRAWRCARRARTGRYQVPLD